ncbi:hypothetical protein Tco_0750226 [Tanacetum coccineum]|uniref:Uncharacterized protein n=1 Tax=Tanacetum coccineum TaxID=301880 RepID=A0ABQ4Z0V1_9ASTR
MKSDLRSCAWSIRSPNTTEKFGQLIVGLMVTLDLPDPNILCIAWEGLESLALVEGSTPCMTATNFLLAIQADYDIKATNIILQGLPPEIYALVSNHKVAKELWERIQLLMQGTSLTMIWRLYLLHIDLCRPMRVASVNEKKSKDEAPDFIIKFLKMIQVRLIKLTVRESEQIMEADFVNSNFVEYYEMVGSLMKHLLLLSTENWCR